MADHGEAWGEHKVYFHGQDLFDEQLRVPLIIVVPGQPPQVIDEPVLLVDVGADAAGPGRRADPGDMRGRSLLPRIEGRRRRAARAPAFGELLPATAWPHHATMMIDGNHKLIHRISDRRWELYDLRPIPARRRTSPRRRDRRRWWRG